MKINLRVDPQGTISSSEYPDVIRVEHEDDGSLTFVVENPPEAVGKQIKPSTFQSRLNDELAELRRKLEKLDTFIQGPAFEKINGQSRQLLIEQQHVMKIYARILELRIDLLNAESLPEYHPV